MWSSRTGICKFGKLRKFQLWVRVWKFESVSYACLKITLSLYLSLLHCYLQTFYIIFNRHMIWIMIMDIISDNNVKYQYHKHMYIRYNVVWGSHRKSICKFGNLRKFQLWTQVWKFGSVSYASLEITLSLYLSFLHYFLHTFYMVYYANISLKIWKYNLCKFENYTINLSIITSFIHYISK